MQQKKIRVLVVDDSSFMRKVISQILASDPEIEVVGTASDGKFVLAKMDVLNPDVITLDVEMAEMDGIETLKKIMATKPCPVVMLSSLTQDGANTTIKALHFGAVDFIAKPSGQISLDIESQKKQIIQKVKYAASVEVKKVRQPVSVIKSDAAAQKSLPQGKSGFSTCTKAVIIGISTGGPQTLMSILPKLPSDIDAAVLVVQHMPEGFTLSLANHLNEICALRVCEAQHGEFLSNGVVYIAKGGSHMTITREKMIHIGQEPYGSLYKPSVNVTMDSVSDVFGARMVGVIMTGMGKDGTDSIVKARAKGARTIAESEETAIIFGMPKEAINSGAIEYALPSCAIPEKVVSLLPELGIRKSLALKQAL